MGILFARGFNPIIEEKIADADGRFLIIQFKLGDHRVTLANFYAPTQSEPRDQNQFLAQASEALDGLEIHTLFLGGDLNVSLDLYDQGKTRHSSQLDAYVAKIKALMDEYTLVDLWKIKNPTSTRGTFHRGKYSARLDYWLVPSSLSPQASIKIIPQPLSDHCLVTLKICLMQAKRGPGFWRFDNQLLLDNNFTREMSDYLTDIQQERLSDPQLLWEWAKFKTREFCIKYVVTKNREKRKQVQELEKRLLTLAEEYDLTSSPDVIEETAYIKRELGEIKQTKANAAAFRARAKWALQGEKPSAYFLGLEKRLSKNNTITTLLDSEGRTITNNKDILQMEKEYFQGIYTENPLDFLGFPSPD